MLLRWLTVLVAVTALAVPGVSAAQANPPHGQWYGSVLICDDGYQTVGNRCVQLPPVAHGHYFGSVLLCDDGYQATAGTCVALPRVTHGHYFGSVLLCDDGYGDVGGRCAALPAVAHGHYFGSVLICDDGYGAVGGDCVALPRVAHGHYFGSVLLCDDGYAARGGGCARLPTIAHGHYFGAVPICDSGYSYSATSSRCVYVAGSAGGGIAVCPSDSYALAGRCFKVSAATYPVARAAVPTTYVPPYCGENGSCYGDISVGTGRPKTVYVHSYYRGDGTYVRSHYRSTPSFHFHP